MLDETYKWLPLGEAAKHFGYSHPDSLRNRLRELRKRGKVIDLGTPPIEYKVGKGGIKDKIVLYWANPNTALLRSDAPTELLIPKRGKRSLALK